MKIAIDIDDTLFTCNSIIYKVLNKLQKVGHPKEKTLTYKTVTREKPVNTGFLKFIMPVLNPKNYVAYADALETIKGWHEEGHEIILLSSRPSKIKALKHATLDLLEKFDVKYDSLVIGCRSKHMFCKAYNVDLLIDDHKTHCTLAAENGISSICINNSNNKEINPVKNLFFANNWKATKTLFKFIEQFNINKKKTILELHTLNDNDIQQLAKLLFDEIIPSKYALYKHDSGKNEERKIKINFNKDDFNIKPPEK